MAVGADAGVGVGDRLPVTILARPHRLRDMFQVDLVADAGAGGYRLEIVEALRPPFQKVIAFAIAVIFDFDILLERLGVAELVDHHTMVDDQVEDRKSVVLGKSVSVRVDFGGRSNIKNTKMHKQRYSTKRRHTE